MTNLKNIDRMKDLILQLQNENRELRKLLSDAGVEYNNKSELVNIDYSESTLLKQIPITEDLANRFFSMFWGRKDVFARRGKNGGYYPQCKNRWNSLCPKNKDGKASCDNCQYKSWIALSLKSIVQHLKGERVDGTDVIGIYPALEDGTSRLLVFDFDYHDGNEDYNESVKNKEWMLEVDSLRSLCRKQGFFPLVERSRSGNGAHVWLFFEQPVTISKVRQFGFMLLEKGKKEVSLKSFRYYDRMFPTSSNNRILGNLIALPLQGRALLNGNSSFVDENWNPFSNQWDVLFKKVKKISMDEIDSFLLECSQEMSKEKGMLFSNETDIPKPWNCYDDFSKSDVIGDMEIVLSNGIYINTINLMPNIQNQIRSLAAFDNPIYYKNQRLGYSNYNNSRVIYLGYDIQNYISIPRGLQEKLIERCNTSNINYQILDKRQTGKRLKIEFDGQLYDYQRTAIEKMLSHDCGVLNATTAFGKTVVCSYLIAQRKVNTLILLQSKDLLEQWVEELNRFLIIDESLPEYKTKTGRIKRRKSIIGSLTGNKNTLTGIVDVATVGAMYAKGEFRKELNQYGMVIMDECHHCGSKTSIAVMQKVDAEYVYGVTATPKRGDHLDKVIHFLLGPIRYSFTAKQRAIQQGIGHYVYPRFTRVIDFRNEIKDLNHSYHLISKDTIRNQMIIEDVCEAIDLKRTVLILTKYKLHAKELYDNLKSSADHVLLLYGDNSDKENLEIRRKLKEISSDKTVLLIATGQKVGEGFDFPRLDTLILASPISFDGRVEQFVGRMHRDYPGKTEVIVYDYIDSHLPMFKNMYEKRLKAYKRLGYSVISNNVVDKQETNYIYDSKNYFKTYKQDLIEANDNIVISSSLITHEEVNEFIDITKDKISSGCQITIITMNPEMISFIDETLVFSLIKELKDLGYNIIVKDNVYENYAILDKEIVWHGGVHLLGKEELWENLIRIKSRDIAQELLELSLSNIEE